MADERQSSALQTASSAASAVQSAAKTGKAISGAAKGAAAGGPYGAAAMALLKNRQLAGKIVATAAFLLALPVLCIMMLPSLIFGGLAASAEGILNDNATTYANIGQGGDRGSTECHGRHVHGCVRRRGLLRQ